MQAQKVHNENAGVPDSEFQMWRAVFAFSLVDNVLSIEEQEMLNSYKSMVPFSEQQLSIIRRDFERKQDVVALYNGITRQEDKKRFCVLARALVWTDGDIDEQEKKILKKVACLKEPPGSEVLAATRGHDHVEKYYQQYAKAGLVGILDTPHILQMTI